MISLSFNAPGAFASRSITPVVFNGPDWRLRGCGLFLAGSCFADYLYSEFEGLGLRAGASPFGNIYNPVSLAEGAAMLAGDAVITEADLFESAGSFRHFMFQARNRAPAAAEVCLDLNKKMEEARFFIRNAEAVVITLGTSLVYRLKSGNGRIVSNCHKLPADGFSREQLGVDETAESLAAAAAAFLKINPDLRFVLTLSPVRHLRDNASENSLSKAVLRCAADRLCSEQGERIWYFPSFEIMLDELRDYRWYAEDLCHPSKAAVEYIISRFVSSAFDDEFRSFLERLIRVRRDLNHKPLDPESDEYRRFREKAEKEYEDLRKTNPGLFR